MNRSSRSAPSKALLVKAASELIHAKGIEGVRVREVASIAGMSPASVLYHYPRNEDLIFDVHTLAITDYLARRTVAANSQPDPRLSLAAAFKVGMPSTDDAADDTTIRLMYEMHAIAQRSESHRALLTELWNREIDLSVSIISRGLDDGSFRIDSEVTEAAKVLLVIEDGLALHLTSDMALTSDECLRLYLAQASQVLNCFSLQEALHSKITDEVRQ